MRLDALAKAIRAEIRCQGLPIDLDLGQVYAGDRISDLLNAAEEHALLVSNLASSHLTRVAELMDIPGICLVNRQEPDETMLAAAEEHRTTLLVSPVSLFETCGRIHACLTTERSPQR